MHNIAPLYYHYRIWLSQAFGQFGGHHARLVEPVKIKVMQLQRLACFIYTTNGKRRALYDFVYAKPMRQAFGKGSFAPAYIAYKFEHFATAQYQTYQLGDGLGCIGAMRYDGVHIDYYTQWCFARIFIMLICSMRRRFSGFTVVELLIVIVVIGVLSTIAITSFGPSSEQTYFSKAKVELEVLGNAVKLWLIKNNDYPADGDPGLPAGIEEFISKTDTNGTWPDGPWPGSSYDYDRWNISGVDTVQISIHFCSGYWKNELPCKYPKQSWASSFNPYSTVYFCVKGRCQANSGSDSNWPGYCVNCPNNKAITN